MTVSDKSLAASPYARDMHIEIDQLSVTGHVVFAGRDGMVKVQTGGNVAQNTNQTSTSAAWRRLPRNSTPCCGRSAAWRAPSSRRPLLPDAREAAQLDLKTVEAQLTTPKKPNQHILLRAAKSLLRYSPALTAAALTLFDQPLVGAIVASAGEAASSFHDLVSRHSKPSDS